MNGKNPFKKTKESKERVVGYWLKMGLSQSDIARQLGISRQLVRYWIGRIRKNGKARS